MKKQKKSAADQLDEEAKRRALNRLASRQAISESQAQPEFHANHERLKAERLGRESQPNGMGMSNLGMQQPAPELPDDTPLAEVELPVRIRNALSAAAEFIFANSRGRNSACGLSCHRSHFYRYKH